jgi:NAD(P)-dependent dehydrogenase (short-subunit alcohol dehydrogenase family)
MTIPIEAAKKFAEEQGCTQVIIAAWDGERTHIVTYGKTVEDCAQAAEGGNKIKEALQWPKDLRAEPARVQALLDRIEKLEDALSSIDSLDSH